MYSEDPKTLSQKDKQNLNELLKESLPIDLLGDEDEFDEEVADQFDLDLLDDDSADY